MHRATAADDELEEQDGDVEDEGEDGLRLRSVSFSIRITCRWDRGSGVHTGASAMPSVQSPLPSELLKLAFVRPLAVPKSAVAAMAKTMAMRRRMVLRRHLGSFSKAARRVSTLRKAMLAVDVQKRVEGWWAIGAEALPRR